MELSILGAALPDRWSQLLHHDEDGTSKDWDICPSCSFAIKRFLFSKERIDVIVEENGHAGERADYEQHRRSKP